MSSCIGATIIGLVMYAGSALGQPPTQTAAPEQMQRLLSCEARQGSTERLQCFDREIAAIRQSLERRDLVVVDRAQATQTRRGLFGFSVSGLGGLFDGDGEDEVKQIESLVKRGYRNPEGGWTVLLGDNSRWTQTDDSPIALEPRSGDKVVIKRAAFGSFSMSVNQQPGVKVRRIG